MENAPNDSNPAQLGGNVVAIFRTSRGTVATFENARALAQVDGNFRLFDSLTDYREFYKDNDTWPEITNPADQNTFLSAANLPLRDVNSGAPTSLGQLGPSPSVIQMTQGTFS